MAKSIGILGGTFNPIHYGHLLLAEEARTQFSLDEILFIPSHTPPHRIASPGDDLLGQEERYIMTVLATLSHPAFRVSPVELKRGGISYTYDTVAELKKEKPDHDYYLILGADSLTQHHWYRFPELLEILEGLLVASRQGESFEKACQKAKMNASGFHGKLREIKMDPVLVSATLVRKKIKDGQSIRYLVPEIVEHYIHRYHLYRAAEVYQH